MKIEKTDKEKERPFGLRDYFQLISAMMDVQDKMISSIEFRDSYFSIHYLKIKV